MTGATEGGPGPNRRPFCSFGVASGGLFGLAGLPCFFQGCLPDLSAWVVERQSDRPRRARPRPLQRASRADICLLCTKKGVNTQLQSIERAAKAEWPKLATYLKPFHKRHCRTGNARSSCGYRLLLTGGSLSWGEIEAQVGR